MSELFEETDRLETIPMPDGEVYYLNNLDLGAILMQILHQLIADVPWRQENILVWGKMYLQPRLVAWYGDRGSRLHLFRDHTDSFAMDRSVT